jgi:hypothetical protein
MEVMIDSVKDAELWASFLTWVCLGYIAQTILIKLLGDRK